MTLLAIILHPVASSPAPLRLTSAESQELGITRPAAPPPPGVSTTLVALCAFGCLLTVLLIVRGEQMLAQLR